jgi:heme-degrading monooxygenase HmoA
MSPHAAPYLAQLNVGRLVAPIEDPRIAGFRDRLDEVNALADAAPGFVWRLQDEGGNATEFRPDGDPDLLVNLSTWDSLDSLRAFTYQTPHLELLRGRSDWFQARSGPHLVLWWTPAEAPSVEEAMERLVHLAEHGPTPRAFTFAQAYPPGG